MLETTDADEDYFAPLPSTSLSSIFSKVNTSETPTVNDSLKYIPPKPKQDNAETECVFISFFLAFEWSNNNYVAKGNVGLAIMKAKKTGLHNLIIYDANKSILSSTKVSPSLTLNVKNFETLQFYDVQGKYWMLQSQHDNIKETLAELQKLDMNIIYLPVDETETGKQQSVVTKTDQNDLNDTVDKQDNDSDSSVKKQNKAALLSRIAGIGHAILPPLDVSNTSSDNTEVKISKPHKVKTKKIFNSQDVTKKEIPSFSSEEIKINDVNEHNLSPKSTESFIIEQRINNSELRINLGRLSDKVDLVLHSLYEQKNNSDKEFENEVCKKLINEYEHKLKNYEMALGNVNVEKFSGNSKNIERNSNNEDNISDVVRQLENKLINLQKITNTKHSTECHVEQKIDNLKSEIVTSVEDNLRAEINELKSLVQSTVLRPSQTVIQEDQYSQDKVKEAMNDVFHTISVQLEDDTEYSGKFIKKLVAKSIKKVTAQLLESLLEK